MTATVRYHHAPNDTISLSLSTSASTDGIWSYVMGIDRRTRLDGATSAWWGGMRADCSATHSVTVTVSTLLYIPLATLSSSHVHIHT